MKMKIIRTESEYEQALAYLDTLMDSAPGSSEEEELELLAMLIEKYEQERYPIDLPDPVDAIQFRMDQQNLTRQDLIPYLGSQSKVSEVLNRKRPLSLAMMRALHEGLGIPAEVLLREPGKELPVQRFNPADFPLREMVNGGYFPGIISIRKAREQVEELLEHLLSPLDTLVSQMVYCRNGTYQAEVSSGLREEKEPYRIQPSKKIAEQAVPELRCINENALRAWQARVLQICEAQKIGHYKHSAFTTEFICKIVQLSVFPNGALLARQVLLDSGIHFAILPHLPQTYLDGACFKTSSGNPVVAMTLRYDRLDHFWFTLAHELAHVCLHLNKTNYAFFDDMENELSQTGNQQEQEANQLSRDLLIPPEDWQNKKDELLATMDAQLVKNAAKEWNISPAIVAGRLRWETRDYSILGDLLGSGAVRKMFQ